MRRGLYKKDPRPRKRARGRSSSPGISPNYLRFNKEVDECRWISSLVGRVSNCDFVLEGIDVVEVNGKELVIVEIPTGTKLYHATFIPPGKEKWFETLMPFDSGKGLVWFASTSIHSSIINHTHMLEYTVDKPLTMVYEKNIAITYANKRVTKGYDYLPILMGHMMKLASEFDINIDGYIGCNECEIGILNDSVKEKLSKYELHSEKSLSYIE